jgi:hypothetical protein
MTGKRGNVLLNVGSKKKDKDLVFLTFRKLYLCHRRWNGKARSKLMTKNGTRNHSNRGCKMGRKSYLEIV